MEANTERERTRKRKEKGKKVSGKILITNNALGYV
jgi:hypothetical protein